MAETKTALVTSALGGLGRAIVRALMEGDCRVVLVGIDKSKLEEYIRGLPAPHGPNPRGGTCSLCSYH